MPHSFSANFVHVVFSTKYRRETIPSELAPRLSAYMAGIIKKLGSDALAVGGTRNHVHVLISVRPTVRLADTVQKLKANSSRWIAEPGISFEWQVGYGAFSVSPSMVATVKAYIDGQEQHHRARSYDEEFLAILEKSGIRCGENEALG